MRGYKANRTRAITSGLAGNTAKTLLTRSEFGPGRDVFVLSQGDFSLIDWLDALLGYTGPGVDLVISTWVAAAADLFHLDRWLRRGKARSIVWLMDYSIRSRRPELVEKIRALSDQEVLLVRNHAKFSLISSGDRPDGSHPWKIVSITSANLNKNRRIEFFHAADDPPLYDHMMTLVRDVAQIQTRLRGDPNRWNTSERILDGLRQRARMQQAKQTST